MKTLQTLHGEIKLPAFMPDATYGTIKAMTFDDLAKTGTQELVTTTLHLENKLGHDYVEKYGGLHKFFRWDRPILTDSGGYQVFSLIYRNPNKNNVITDAGCSFKDHTNGDTKFLSPEISQIIQKNLGADIVTVLDVPIRHDASTHEMREAIQRNTEWARRSKQKFLEINNLTEADFANPDIKRPLIGAVVQGGNDKELRRISAETLVEVGFDIYNYGGIPIHKEESWYATAPKGFNREMIEYVASILPSDKIKYAMGVGSPDDIIFSVSVGWDLFDTVLPTRNARHGYLYVSKGQGDQGEESGGEHYEVLHLKNKQHEYSEDPIDSNCSCEACLSVSRAYLRHLIKLGDLSGARLASIHNLTFYQKVMTELRSY